MQLVAYGAQDIYLTGNPQITFFKVVYRRHTNFSMEAIQQTWNGQETSADGRCTATISRNGDLVYRMYLELSGQVAQSYSNVGSSSIKDVELEIGGQKIDKHTGHWMEVWSQLTQSNPSCTSGALDSSSSGVTGGTLFQRMSGQGGVKGSSVVPTVTTKLFVPLQFWFCRNPGLALPLIALQYHEVKVILNHRIGSSLGGGSNPSIENKLWCDYIYLDTDERRRFAQVSHEYLIEQVQEQTWSSSQQELNFNHPVKELIMSKSRNFVFDGSADIVTSDAITGNPILKLNGHDRFAARDAKYFTRTQVWEHHTGSGGINAVADTGGEPSSEQGQFKDTIGVYSFALKPEEHQPSGTCNFSRIDNAQLTGTSVTNIDTVFAVNYNVLRIMSGMGGLAYSN
jgi:hypothetical protein